MFFKKKKSHESRRQKTETEERTIVDIPHVSRAPEFASSKPKPWGKKERYTVLGLFGGMAFISLCLALSARNGKLPGLPRVAAPDNMFRETIVLEPTPRDNQWDQTEMKTSWEALTGHLSGVYGFQVFDLVTGDSYGINDREPYTAASLMKLPVLLAMYRESERGLFNLDGNYTLIDADKVGGSGSIINQKAGTVFTYRQLAEAMGHQSDNTALRAVSKKLGDSLINKMIEDIGMRDTNYAENITTPADITLLFKKMWQGGLISSKSRDEILGYLTKTIYEDYLAKGIPDTIRVAHKYGREVHVVNDAGIVFTAHPTVITIMTKGVIEKEADAVFPSLAELLFTLTNKN